MVTVYSGLVCHQHCDIASIPSKRRWHGPYLLAGHKTREKQKIKIKYQLIMNTQLETAEA